jgi:hypothetical protein
VILVPFLGTLVYLVSRPSGPTAQERRGAPDIVSNGVAELAKLAELHDRGKLTDSEFAAEKARLLGAETVPA